MSGHCTSAAAAAAAVLSAVWSGHQPINWFPYMVFLLEEVARHPEEFKKRNLPKADEHSSKLNGHLEEWDRLGLHSYGFSHCSDDTVPQCGGLYGLKSRVMAVGYLSRIGSHVSVTMTSLQVGEYRDCSLTWRGMASTWPAYPRYTLRMNGYPLQFSTQSTYLVRCLAAQRLYGHRRIDDDNDDDHHHPALLHVLCTASIFN